jgi:hypothetical protein
LARQWKRLPNLTLGYLLGHHAAMKKIFVDANIYLDFYRIKSTKSLLPAIGSMAPHIVVTEQVVAEVLRNKVDVARSLLREDINKFTLNSPLLPDFLTKQAVDETSADINNRLKAWENEYKEINKLVEKIYDRTICHVSRGDDEVSKTLEHIFSNALNPTAEDIAKARQRKDFGRPPGKKGDPIGDELSWEQLISLRNETGSEIWVVSRDEDFYTLSITKNPVPNAYLLRELGDGPNVLFFKDLPTALKNFKNAEFPELELPSDELLEEVIREAEKGETADQCRHQVEVIQNGIFDIYRCQKCGKQLGAYHADFD